MPEDARVLEGARVLEPGRDGRDILGARQVDRDPPVTRAQQTAMAAGGRRAPTRESEDGGDGLREDRCARVDGDRNGRGQRAGKQRQHRAQRPAAEKQPGQPAETGEHERLGDRQREKPSAEQEAVR